MKTRETEISGWRQELVSASIAGVDDIAMGCKQVVAAGSGLRPIDQAGFRAIAQEAGSDPRWVYQLYTWGRTGKDAAKILKAASQLGYIAPPKFGTGDERSKRFRLDYRDSEAAKDIGKALKRLGIR